ncbi:PP2C family serine/threonine-protein phosphatase [Sphingopyxis sp. PET50]|uniref:PP2C family protein-serine/threonine phosphatase n=1 Tax=Sphingopyxis sp. PET50 TaxID=2976533 RepID=UPI0021B0769E|nr:protein phosphatase 2C domain-containing protein [Sphingopyxis sp. PET50]
MSSAIQSSALEQIVGRRAEQQDMLAEGVARLSGGGAARLFVIADGMGGHSGGAVAATLAVNGFLGVCESGAWDNYPDVLRHALLAANRAIGEHARTHPALSDMGCTLVAAALDGRELHYISVGDSPFFCLGPAGLERVNADHSMAPLIDAAIGRGEMTIEEARDHPQRSALRSAMTGKSIALVDDGGRTLAGGEVLILASDGVLTLDEAQIVDAVAVAGRDAGAIVARMLDLVEARAQPDQDNCSLAVVVIDPPPPPPPLAAGRPRGRRGRLFGWGALLLGVLLAAAAWIAFRGLGMPGADAEPAKAAETGETAAETAALGDPDAEGSPRRPGYDDLVPVRPAAARKPEASAAAKSAPETGKVSPAAVGVAKLSPFPSPEGPQKPAPKAAAAKPDPAGPEPAKKPDAEEPPVQNKLGPIY